MNDASTKVVCAKCVGDPIVSSEILADGARRQCSYCGRKRKCIGLPSLAERVDEVYRAHVTPSSDDIYLRHDEDDDAVFGSSGGDPEELIAEMLQSEADIAEDIVAILSEEESYRVQRDGDTPLYDSQSSYAYRDSSAGEYSAWWLEFVEAIKHRTRFFEQSAIERLTTLFSGLDKLGVSGPAASIRTIGPTSEERFVFRARKANSAEERIQMCLDPGNLLGPPPKQSTPAGRMNASGIPAFYGAFSPDTCVAELRLGTGEMAVCCKFEIISPIRVLDLTTLKDLYHSTSIFDPNYDDLSTRLAFLTRFEDAVSRAVTPGADLEYLPTQVLAEYLAYHHKPTIDAVIYTSTQNSMGLHNIAVFNHAAIIQGRRTRSRSRYEESLGDYSYSIWDRKGSKQRRRQTFDFFGSDITPKKPKARLKPDLDSVTVHRIEVVKHGMVSTPFKRPVHREKDLKF